MLNMDTWSVQSLKQCSITQVLLDQKFFDIGISLTGTLVNALKFLWRNY